MSTASRRKPENIDDVLEVIRRGRLDRRTRQARSVEEVKVCLEMRPDETMKAMLRHTISLNHLVERELVAFVAEKHGELLDADGRLPKALSEDLLKMQTATLRALKQLALLEGHQAPKDAPDRAKDVADIVLEANSASAQGGAE